VKVIFINKLKAMDPNAVQLITQASQLLSDMQFLLIDANNSTIKGVKELSTKMLNKTAGLVKTMSQIGVLTGKMEGEIQAMRDRPYQSTEPESIRQNSVIEAINELEERRDKSKNVLLMNVPESNSATQALKLKDDLNVVINIVDKFDNLRKDNIKISRIGREDPEKIRPIKVTFSDCVDARHLLQNSRIIKGGIRAKPDMTMKQREQLRTLWKEVEDRRAAGEENLTVKFFNSFPKIVQTQKNFAKELPQVHTIRTSVA
jgi:hypothetical protein